MTETPNYPWYQVGKIEDFQEDDPQRTENVLQQGFLIFDCPIFDVSNYYNGLNDLEDGEEIDIEPDIKQVDLIIMTQSCDLAKKETEQVLLSSFFPASDSGYKKFVDDIRKARRPALCMIEASESADIDLPSFERQIIDFRQVYTLPKEYILEFIGDKTIVRLLPPYREYVAQAFARFFMRVGLPKDFK